MKKEQEFDNILDECLERILNQGETVEQCLARYPEHVAELEPLLQTAFLSMKAAAVTPRPEFKERARHEFHMALQELETKKGGWFLGWRPQWVSVVAVVLALLLASGGTVAAAGGSMPDEPLYQVKLVTEKVQLALTPSALGKAELYVKLADRRVAEIAHMAGKGKLEQVAATAELLTVHLNSIADLAAPREKGPRKEAATFMAPAPEAVVREAPETPTAKVPGGAVEKEPEIAVEEAPPVTPERAPRMVRGAPGKVPEEASQEVPEPPGTVAEGKRDDIRGEAVDSTRETRLEEISQRFHSQREALQEALEKAPAAMKPALRQALAIVERGYEEAIKSIEEAAPEPVEEETLKPGGEKRSQKSKD